MNVLIACEFSGVVRRAFRERGHEAWSCDLLPAEDGSPFHYQCDAIRAMNLHGGWDLMIHHSPCTFILNSGCKWLYKDGKRYLRDESGKVIGENPRDLIRWQKMREGAVFFRTLQNANIPKIAGENPIMVGHALEIIGQDYTQLIHPYEFGHMEQKSTCLWLKNLPPLKPTNNVYDEMMKLPKRERERVHYASPGVNRWAERSRTFTGIAKAMAEQWG